MEIVTKAVAKGVEETENGVVVRFEAGGEEKKVEADYVLVTVGRRPNTDEMGLEEIGIKMGERGLIEVDILKVAMVIWLNMLHGVVAGLQLAHKASYEGKVAAEVFA